MGKEKKNTKSKREREKIDVLKEFGCASTATQPLKRMCWAAQLNTALLVFIRCQ